MENENQVWTIHDHVEELRGKHYLKKKDFEAYREGSKYVMDHNDKVMTNMRQENKKKRQYIFNPQCGDKYVVQTVFKEEKETRLTYERKSAENAKSELTQRALLKVNTLNRAKYEKEKKKLKLRRMKEQLELLKLENSDQPEIRAVEKQYTMLENTLDKAMIKKETAQLITKQYREILEHLNREHLGFPARLTKLENTLMRQKRELAELHEMATDADQARDHAKQMLAQMEQQTLTDIKQRGELLQATRKEVERRGQENERIDKRGQRVMLITEQQEPKDSHIIIQRKSNQRAIFTYEDALMKIKEASHEADVEGVVQRVINQKETNTSLKNKVHELESLTKRMKEEHAKLCEQYREMKYSGGATLSRGEKLLEDMGNRIDDEDDKKRELEASLQKNGGCYVNIKSGIFTLLEKLRDVKLKPPQHNFTNGDALDQMNLVCKKINQLLKDLDADTVNHALAKINIPYFQNFVETHLQDIDEVTGLHRKASDKLVQYFDQQEEEVLSSEDIKKAGRALIDSKNKPRKQKKLKK